MPGRRFDSFTPDERPERPADPAVRRENLRRIFRLFRPYRARLAAVSALIVFSASLGAVSPFLLREVLDVAIPEEDVGLLTALVAYVETRLRFDWEDRVGWSLVPAAVFLALKLNAPRHLLLVLLVPDKRGLRNVAAAVAMLAPAVAPSVVRFGSAGPVAIVILLGGLVMYLQRIGWTTVLDDLRHPVRTIVMTLGAAHARMT